MNKFQQKNLTSTSVFSIGYSYRLTEHRISAQQQALTDGINL
jgi:hypothetical protein